MAVYAEVRLIKILLVIESLSIRIFGAISILAVSFLNQRLTIFIMIVFIVTEAALGLGVLIRVRRLKGRQSTKLSLFKLTNYEPSKFKLFSSLV